MKFSPYTINLLEQKCGKDIRLSGDCEYLALDIESVTGEPVQTSMPSARFSMPFPVPIYIIR